MSFLNLKSNLSWHIWSNAWATSKKNPVQNYFLFKTDYCISKSMNLVNHEVPGSKVKLGVR